MKRLLALALVILLLGLTAACDKPEEMPWIPPEPPPPDLGAESNLLRVLEFCDAWYSPLEEFFLHVYFTDNGLWVCQAGQEAIKVTLKNAMDACAAFDFESWALPEEYKGVIDEYKAVHTGLEPTLKKVDQAIKKGDTTGILAAKEEVKPLYLKSREILAPYAATFREKNMMLIAMAEEWEELFEPLKEEVKKGYWGKDDREGLIKTFKELLPVCDQFVADYQGLDLLPEQLTIRAEYVNMTTEIKASLQEIIEFAGDEKEYFRQGYLRESYLTKMRRHMNQTVGNVTAFTDYLTEKVHLFPLVLNYPEVAVQHLYAIMDIEGMHPLFYYMAQREQGRKVYSDDEFRGYVRAIIPKLKVVSEKHMYQNVPEAYGGTGTMSNYRGFNSWTLGMIRNLKWIAQGESIEECISGVSSMWGYLRSGISAVAMKYNIKP